MKDKQRSTSPMKDKHTPGPWIVRDDQIQDIHGNTIACITAGEYWNTTEGIVTKEMPMEANARLMAAAPEMKEDLEEAVRLLKHLRYLYDVEMCEDEAYINDFITKAESTLAKIEGDE